MAFTINTATGNGFSSHNMFKRGQIEFSKLDDGIKIDQNSFFHLFETGIALLGASKTFENSVDIKCGQLSIS